MISNPHVPAIQTQSVNWRHIAEMALLVALAFVLAVLIVGLLLAISADRIEVG